jgi:hypothetical protein
MENMAENGTYRKAMGYQAAGTADTLNGTAIDTQGFTRVKFMALFGAITGTAVVTFKVQGDSASAFNVAAADITGATITVADDDDNQVAVVEVVNPSETYRYLRAVVVRATANAVVDAIICELSGGGQLPAPQSATYVSTGTVVSVPCQ